MKLSEEVAEAILDKTFESLILENKNAIKQMAISLPVIIVIAFFSLMAGFNGNHSVALIIGGVFVLFGLFLIVAISVALRRIGKLRNEHLG